MLELKSIVNALQRVIDAFDAVGKGLDAVFIVLQGFEDVGKHWHDLAVQHVDLR